MPATLYCPNCRKRLKVPENILGKKGQCPRCRDKFFLVESATKTAPRFTSEESQNGHRFDTMHVAKNGVAANPPIALARRVPVSPPVAAPVAEMVARESIPPEAVTRDEGIGQSNGMPLSLQHQRELRLAEGYRKKVRQAAIAYRIYFLFNVVGGIVPCILVFFFIILGERSSRLAPEGIVFLLFAFLIWLGLVAFHYALHHFTWRNEQWAPISASVLYVLCVLGAFMFIAVGLITQHDRPGHAWEVLIPGGLMAILPLILAILSIRAAIAIPLYNGTPHWCQRLLNQLDL